MLLMCAILLVCNTNSVGYTGSAGCLPTLLFSVECGADKEGSEGGGMGAIEVSEEMKGDCCNQVTADHQHITL